MKYRIKQDGNWPTMEGDHPFDRAFGKEMSQAWMHPNGEFNLLSDLDVVLNILIDDYIDDYNQRHETPWVPNDVQTPPE